MARFEAHCKAGSIQATFVDNPFDPFAEGSYLPQGRLKVGPSSTTIFGVGRRVDWERTPWDRFERNSNS